MLPSTSINDRYTTNAKAAFLKLTYDREQGRLIKEAANKQRASGGDLRLESPPGSIPSLGPDDFQKSNTIGKVTLSKDCVRRALKAPLSSQVVGEFYPEELPPIPPEPRPLYDYDIPELQESRARLEQELSAVSEELTERKRLMERRSRLEAAMMTVQNELDSQRAKERAQKARAIALTRQGGAIPIADATGCATGRARTLQALCAHCGKTSAQHKLRPVQHSSRQQPGEVSWTGPGAGSIPGFPGSGAGMGTRSASLSDDPLAVPNFRRRKIPLWDVNCSSFVEGSLGPGDGRKWSARK